MNTQRFGWPVAVALLLGLLGGAGVVWSWHVRAERKLVVSQDSLLGVVRAKDSLYAEARADTVAIQVRRDVIRWRMGRVDSLYDTLRLQAPDSLRPLVEALGLQLRSERRDRDSLVSLLQSQLALWRDTLFPEVVMQRNRATELLAAAIRQGRRGHGWKTDVALVGVTVAAVTLLRN